MDIFSVWKSNHVLLREHERIQQACNALDPSLLTQAWYFFSFVNGKSVLTFAMSYIWFLFYTSILSTVVHGFCMIKYGNPSNVMLLN